jgi:hypothetical protein
MSPDELTRLLVAPEILLVDVADAALRALLRGLLVEHPLLDDPNDHQRDRLSRSARASLRHARRLRRALHLYRRCVERALATVPDENLPF